MNSVVKKLKNPSFKIIDSALCCTLFVAYQVLFEVFYRLIPSSIKGNLFVAIIASILVEAVFFFAAWTTSMVGKVQFFKASKIAEKIDYKSALLAVAISLICLFGFNGVTNLFVMFLNALGYEQVVSDVVIPNFATYLLYALTLCVVPAVFEEFCFRGCILNGLKPLGEHKAVWISAVFFMLMHGGPDQTVHQLIVGAICGYALIYSGSLLIPIIIHFLNNFIAVTIMYIQGQGAATEGAELSYSASELAISCVITILLAALSVYLVILCMKALKKIKSQKEAKTLSMIKSESENLESSDGQEKSQEREVPEDSKALEKPPIFEDKKSRIWTIVFFAISVAYLVVNWINTLIIGLI